MYWVRWVEEADLLATGLARKMLPATEDADSGSRSPRSIDADMRPGVASEAG